MLPGGMDPRSGRAGGKQLKKIGFREGWRLLRTQGGSLLGDTVKLAAEPRDLIKG